MNSITSCKIFKSVDKLYNVTGNLKAINANIDKYIVPYKHYEFFVSSMKSNKRALARMVMDNLSKKNIVPILLEDPVNISDKMIHFPHELMCFSMKKDGKIISCVNISSKARYARFGGSSEIDYLNIKDTEFYGLMQSGLLFYAMTNYGSQLSIKIDFVRSTTEIYSYTLARIIDAIYPISGKTGGLDILQYICAIYCLQSMFGYDLETAKSYALTLKTIVKTSITSGACKFYNNSSDKFDMRTTRVSEINGETIYPIDVLMQIIPYEFTFIDREEISYRNILSRYTDIYGSNALFAIEHLFTFLNMLQLGVLHVGLFSDSRVDRISGNYVPNLEKILATVIR